jgi:hypothetical protein
MLLEQFCLIAFISFIKRDELPEAAGTSRARQPAPLQGEKWMPKAMDITQTPTGS